MNITTILIIVNVFAAVAMIALTLMQSSKSDMGSAFGGGGSQSMFGSRGSSNFLSKSTALMCAVFFLSSLALAYTYAKRGESSLVDQTVIEEVSEVPTIDVPQTDSSSVPTIEVPEVEAPNIEVPDVEVPGIEIPEVEVPDIEVPDIEVPDLSATPEAQQLEQLESQVKELIEQEKAKASEAISQ